MVSKHSHGLIERREIVGRARLHHATFHDRENEARQLRTVGIRWKLVARIHKPALDAPHDQFSKFS